MKKWIFSLLSLAVFSPLQAQQEYKAPENTRFRIIGYAPSYRNLDAIPKGYSQSLSTPARRYFFTRCQRASMNRARLCAEETIRA